MLPKPAAVTSLCWASLTSAWHATHGPQNGVRDGPQAPLCGCNGARRSAPLWARVPPGSRPGPARVPRRGKKGRVARGARCSGASRGPSNDAEPQPVSSVPRAAAARAPRAPHCTRRGFVGARGVVLEGVGGRVRQRGKLVATRWQLPDLKVGELPPSCHQVATLLPRHQRPPQNHSKTSLRPATKPRMVLYGARGVRAGAARGTEDTGWGSVPFLCPLEAHTQRVTRAKRPLFSPARVVRDPGGTRPRHHRAPRCPGPRSVAAADRPFGTVPHPVLAPLCGVPNAGEQRPA